ncbi:YncE family protein [Oharaeibacter diazotrophicus]|uniref:YVTN family beta-propeller protein n=3 Tax=Oharaeibacter diazotrophicus TaxID=1920512 RepID=A0A4R6RGK5_9HYPH|nr:YncE family protein [Oharaeibacter diazotrophicus]TDP85483.1 YVTN family beta-propeller protein [Oharaeibacter diazotrophicus]BBE74453.1 virginiamycin B lyase [Pleomorphomonas sp. SM30]GLS75851.1 hypothetical protein GCM10007904_11860 [Oharaeibacter diazotrophicus]
MRAPAAVLLALTLTFPAVAAPRPAAFVVVSQAAGVVTGRDGEGAETARLALDKAPAAVVVDAARRRAYVSEPEVGAVAVVDLDGFARAGTLAVGGQPFGLAVRPAGRLLVTDWSADTLTEVDPAGGAARTVAVGQAPSAVVVGPDDRFAYTVDREADQVSVVDLSDFSVVATVDVGRAPFAAALAPGGRRLYVANVQSSDLSVIDLAFRREIARIPIGGMPYGVAISPDGGRIAVTDQEGGRLVLIDARSLAPAGAATVGDYAEGVVALPAVGAFAVANWFSDTVSLVGFDGRSVSHVPVPKGPRMLAALPAVEE